MQIMKTTPVSRRSVETGEEWMDWIYQRNTNPLGVRVSATWSAVRGILVLREIKGDGRKPKEFKVFRTYSIDGVENLIQAQELAVNWTAELPDRR